MRPVRPEPHSHHDLGAVLEAFGVHPDRQVLDAADLLDDAAGRPQRVAGCRVVRVVGAPEPLARRVVQGAVLQL